MKEPPDRILKIIVQAIITLTNCQDLLFLIDKDYQVRLMLPHTEFGMKQATRARTELLRSEDLLAVITTGWVSEKAHHMVCEYYPFPGMVEQYHLSYARPVPVWADPNTPESQEALQAYKDIWTLE